MTCDSGTDRPIGNATGPLAAAWLVLPPIVLSIYAYAAVTRAYFASDDFVYLYRAYNAPLDELLLSPHGGHILIVRNLVFLLFVRLFGTEAPLYFLCVLLTHLVNVVLLFRLVQRLTGSGPLAAIAATVWGATRAHVGTLAWFSVYGQVLACTAILLLLLSAERWHARPPPLVHAGWYVLGAVAATSFGTGLGVVIALPVALAFWARSFGDRAPFPPPLTVLALVLPLLWLALTWRYDDVSPVAIGRWLNTSRLEQADTVLPLHLLRTYARWSTVLVPLDISGQGLFALGNVPSAAAAAPLWLHRSAAVLVALAVGVTAYRLPWPQRQQLVAFAILAASAYLSIAAGRIQLLGGLSVNHRLPFFGRYHYLPGLLLCIVLCLLVNSMQIWRASRRLQNALLAGVLLATAVSLTYAPPPIGEDGTRLAVAQAVDQIRLRMASVPPGGSIDMQNVYVDGLQVMAHKDVFPDLAAMFVIFYPPDELQGRRVRFVDAHPAVVSAAQRGRRSRELIIAPGTAPIRQDAGAASPFF